MSSWKKYKLGELLELVIDHRGKTPKKLGFDDFHSNGYPVLSAKHVKTSGLVNLDVMRFANQEMYEKWMKIPTKKGDIVLTSEAPLGELFYIDGSTQYLLGQRVFGLRTKANLINPMYLFAWLSSPEGQSALQARATGSTVQGIKQSELLNIELSIPDLIEQEKVAEILFNLNNKIQLNTQINQTLEQIAQTIFKSWFIDFDPVHAKANALASGQTAEQATQAAMAVISGKNTQELHRLQTANPEQYQQLWEIAEAFPSGFDEEGVPRGWEERELSYLFEFLSGAQPPKSEHIYEEKEGYERFIQNRDYSNDNHKTYIPISKKNKRCTEKDILMDKYGEAGKVRYGIKGAYNVALAKIVPQKDNLREFLRSYFTQDKIRNYLSSSSMASTRNSLNSTTFTRMKVIVPNDFLLSTFDKLANEKIDKILQIKQENIELSKLRDYLLPKLLSGEV
ncbi:restriction endonuclease subunit S [Glaesserella parasuis]|uniref:restriction endonuclease subunit S n=1 Tax=Glaesserella parasuis TaxID=738 RepID=UPI00094FE6A4|nr:restriction endonuclease subunit S [Glaesserella parasuis]MCT8781544.1 restriction endonuclease subunit S [Glaesserella parasuis]MCT8821374.1 restriction endonuclease subunit S [Glaesserella parasuis]MDE3931129.1 restriction endonuclease subunit S [Glaesserella parasuis]MDE3935038.1 restriction endonuclease subunit S [Glaesserella parasuis]MDE3937797.1 restriction endonuclease subunit S [Glaesserella parasuis]